MQEVILSEHLKWNGRYNARYEFTINFLHTCKNTTAHPSCVN
jgi:hypothetical protein